MRKETLSRRERREIRALAQASYEALVATVKELQARRGRRLEAKAASSRKAP